MDTSRYRRPEIQTQRPTAKNLSPDSPLVSEIVPRRPQTGTLAPNQPDSYPSPVRRVPNISSLAVQGLIASPPPASPPPHGTVPPLVTPPARPLPPLDMEVPGQPSPLRRLSCLVRGKTWRSIRRWSFRTAAALTVLVILAGGVLFSQGYLKLHKVFKASAVSVAALKTNVNPSLLKGEGAGRINVLLLGRGGGNHDAPDLTDTMMLDSIDPVNHTSTLLSIPRDLWVKIPSQGAMKINAAWETGEFKYLGKVAPGSTNSKAIQAGFDQADQTVESVLGVTIDYNVLVDFQAFQQAVDNVGGVAVNVPTDLVDPTMAWENKGNPVLAKAGPQNFDGGTALNYVRSRETTSDFARAQRQRAVLVALKAKVDSLGTFSNPAKLSGLLTTFGNNVQTDLSLKDAARLYSIIKAIRETSTTSVGLADPPNSYVTTGTMAGQAIDLPAAGLFNYSAIQAFIHTQLKDPYLAKEHAKVLVLNGTTLPGVATDQANLLKSYGYNVVGAANTPTSSWTQTTVADLSHGRYKYTAHYLEQRFNVTKTSQLPDNTIQTNGADFVIILGSDEATPAQTQAH